MIVVAKNLSSIIPIMELWLRLVTENQTISMWESEFCQRKNPLQQWVSVNAKCESGQPPPPIGLLQTKCEITTSNK